MAIESFNVHGLSASDGTRRTLLRLAVAAGLIALLWVSFVSHRNFWEFVAATDQTYHAQRVLRAAQHLLNLLQEAEIGVRGFHIMDQDHYLEPYNNAQREIPEALQNLRSLTVQTPDQRDRFEALEPLVNIQMEMRGREIDARRAGGSDIAEIALATKEDRYKVDRIGMLLSEIAGAAEKTLTAEHTVALQNEQRSLYLFIVVDLLTLAVIAFLFISRERALRDRETQVRRESEHRFGQMAAMTGEWLWEQGQEGRFIYSNSAVKEILGYEPEEILGRYYFDLFTPVERKRITEAAYSADSLTRFVRLLNRYQHKDGHEVITESTGIPLRDAGGNIVKWRGVDRDITVHKWFENALRQSEEVRMLQQAAPGKHDEGLAGGASHVG
jgi:PAS domain S-box-containing protein